MIDGGFVDMVEIGNEARTTMKPDALDHRRGEFVALATGVSYGGGQRVCHQYLFLRISAEINIDPRQLGTK